MKSHCREHKPIAHVIVGLILILGTLLLGVALPSRAWALPEINLAIGDDGDESGVPTTLKIVLLLTVLSLAPAIAVMVTSFTRIVVVFSFLRHAIGQQQMPPNQIVVGLALFLTVFVMAPVWQQVQEQAITPMTEGEIDDSEAWKRAMTPIREFMFQPVTYIKN